MSYREKSLWNDQNELRCLEAFKMLESEGFPWGKQIDYARKISRQSGLSVGNASCMSFYSAWHQSNNKQE